MKLKTFKVVGVWGFLTKEISFRDQTTFLIGINGSGKTTILNLLDGLLKPQLKKLLLVVFKEISLIMGPADKQGQLIKIVCKKYEDKMVIIYQDDIHGIYEEHRVNYDGVDFPSKYLERSDYERLEFFFQRSRVYELIKSLPTPVIVGLNRTLKDKDEDHFSSVHSSSYRAMRLSLSNKNEDVNEALNDVIDLIYNHIRENARKQNSLANQFKNQVFDEMLTPPNETALSHNISSDYTRLQELKDLLNRKIVVKETTSLTSKIQDYLSEYQSTIDEFRKLDIKKLLDSTNNEEQKIYRKMMVFNVQFDKIYRVGQIAIDNLRQMESLHSPINRFSNSVNLFFREGHKEIRVDGSGEIIVLNHNLGADPRQSIFDLSSGEKQIIILIAYLAFMSESKIFIVDEPEVSLHVSWQEKFVDALLEASPENQFILATHAPSIIAKSSRRSMCEDLSM